MSQSSPESDSYGDGWRAIQRLIEEGGSLSGRERDLFYANCGDGTFADVSAVAGLDFEEDGRAFATADLDRDGDLDLLVKNRNGPQIRVLRNDVGDRKRAIAFDVGPGAVGARVTLEIGQGRRLKEAKSGSGFLSQSSSRVWFGLGEEDMIQSVKVDWPAGGASRFEGLAAGALYRLRPGAPPRAEPFRADPGADVSAPLTPAVQSGFWLVDPPPAPDFNLPALDGRRYRLHEDRRGPVLLNFWATWCPPCRQELEDFSRTAPSLADRGAGIVAVSLDEPANRFQVERFAAQLDPPFPLLLSDEQFVAAYSLVYRRLSGGRRELPLPFSLLIDRDGRIVRAYAGAVSPVRVLADIDALAEVRKDSLRAASPFPGAWISARPIRDLTAAAQEFLDNDLFDAARRYYEQAARNGELNAGEWNNLALAQGSSGRGAEALESLRQAVAANPKFAEAWQNLGIVLLRSEEVAEGLEALERAAALGQRSYALYHHLGLGYALGDETARAIAAFQAAHRLDATQVDPLIELGALYLAEGRRREAAYVLSKAASLVSVSALAEGQAKRFRALIARIRSMP